ncbi:EamA family transporter [Actinoallomurus rhizosphaericola]|uniref:EamA family transporter n=1 Tax=Actinoallomurus rhizosphaericola TaxID=2952536 RepID=UPI0020926DCD|nr:EamA family transporter [Actinoallomurus rhizosphaericola]MCO5998470.1 EamA family transporter [Actinoallomurus rhizosphaericola]
MTTQTHDSRSPLTWTTLSIVYVVWGSTYLGIHYVVQTMPPLISAGLRFIVAAAVLAAVLAILRGPSVLRVPWRRLGTAALVGLLLLTGGNGMVGIAEQHISSGLAALLVASVPLWLVLFRVATGDRPPVATVAGVLVGFGGLALLTLTRGGGSGDVTGVAVILIASLSWSIGSFLSSRLPMPENPFAASVYEMAAGGVALLAAGFGRGETLHLGEVSRASWLGLAYLIVFGSLVAFTSYVWLLGNAPISLVGTYAYVNPAVAVLLGVAFAGEHASWAILAGGLIIILGVGLVVSTERRPRTDAEPGPAAAVEPAAAEPAAQEPPR